MYIYAIKDEITGFGKSIVLAQNDQEVERSFKTMLMGQKDNEIATWPKDFSLWRLGELVKDTGEILSKGAELIVRGDSIVKGAENDREK